MSFCVCRVQAALGRVRDASLRHCLQFGVGLHHAGLSEPDRQLVEALFVEQKIQVRAATALECCL
jgi:activating signal cointegrator complex subunit 3